MLGGDLAKVKEKFVFTTHTPVPAGHDRFNQELVDKVFKDRYTGFYELRAFLEGKIPKAMSGQDCDNSAEWRSFFCHRELPACAAISLCQPGHRFMGVATLDAGIIWYNGHPRNKECIYAISF